MCVYVQGAGDCASLFSRAIGQYIHEAYCILPIARDLGMCVISLRRGLLPIAHHSANPNASCYWQCRPSPPLPLLLAAATNTADSSGRSLAGLDKFSALHFNHSIGPSFDVPPHSPTLTSALLALNIFVQLWLQLIEEANSLYLLG
jgi:hypothetical protein